MPASALRQTVFQRRRGSISFFTVSEQKKGEYAIKLKKISAACLSILLLFLVGCKALDAGQQGNTGESSGTSSASLVLLSSGTESGVLIFGGAVGSDAEKESGTASVEEYIPAE